MRARSNRNWFNTINENDVAGTVIFLRTIRSNVTPIRTICNIKRNNIKPNVPSLKGGVA